MSILGESAKSFLLPAVFLVVPTIVAARLGVFRRGPLDTPPRATGGQQIWALMMVLGASVFAWLMVQLVYYNVRNAQLVRSQGPQAHFDETHLTPGDWAFLSCAPPLTAAIAVIAGDLLVGGRALLRQLGLSSAHLRRAISAGVVGSFIVIPLVWGASLLLEWVYNAVRFQHPEEHELLKAMGESNGWGPKAALIFGAVVIAPFFEECLFRGHLQTVMRALFTRLVARPASLPPLPPSLLDAPSESSAVSVLPYEMPGQPPRHPPVWPAWAAIVLTASLFALVHPLWSAPVIFVLALGLGYAYERTGSLWTPMVIHCVFNALSTAVYLGSRTH